MHQNNLQTIRILSSWSRTGSAPVGRTGGASAGATLNFGCTGVAAASACARVGAVAHPSRLQLGIVTSQGARKLTALELAASIHRTQYSPKGRLRPPA